jgi:diadenosine tetraphosphatase ApaH/serine/threonine PP2A family protein phosphatase
MRIAIISDIHSNLEALKEAFKKIDSLNVDDIICLGDLVGYGANPNECIKMVKAHCSNVLCGNHDMAVFNPDITESFSVLAYLSAEWTREKVKPEYVSYLRSLPLTYEFGGCLFVHSSPAYPAEWDYIITDADARIAFRYFKQRNCFFGHSHRAEIFYERKSGKTDENPPRRLINVGSIGQPRDGDSRLSFGIYDTDGGVYENIRIEYDVETASKKIRETQLPPQLADRLFRGR